jgi:hypothetical protein
MVFMNTIVVVVQTARCGGGEQEGYRERGEERTGRLLYVRYPVSSEKRLESLGSPGLLVAVWWKS